MKKLLLIIPLVLSGCASQQDQAKNLEMMMGIQAGMLADQPSPQQRYIPKKPVYGYQNQSKSYTVTDENGKSKTYDIRENNTGMGSPTGRE